MPNVDRDLQESFALIQQNLGSSLPLSEIKQTRLNLYRNEYLAALHWAYQKADKSHVLPFKPAQATKKGYKASGDLIYAKLRLCRRIFAQIGTATPYQNAPHWFAQIVVENFRGLIQHDILPGYSTGGSCYIGDQRDRAGETDCVKEYREIAKSLKKLHNPFSPATMPAYFLLLDQAIGIIQQQPGVDFVDDEWSQLIECYQSFAKKVEKTKELTVTWETDGKILYQRARGRSVGILRLKSAS